MKKTWLLTLSLLLTGLAAGIPLQGQNQIRVEPPFWWTGMADSTLQLMIYGENVKSCDVDLSYEGIQLVAVVRTDNPNYLFLDLAIDKTATPGSFTIQLLSKEGDNNYTYNYELKKRRPGSAARKGFDASDVIYLITPDRFSNGDPENDAIAGMKEVPDRDDPVGRHGGDIAGIMKQMDYLYALGVTGVWLNPVLENDQPRASYHGYATTDYYKVDPRYGSNEEYLKLSRSLRDRDMGLVMDMIANHCGSEHWWVKDPPFDDWFNFQGESKSGEFHQTSHMRATLIDPYAVGSDKDRFSKGWFVRTMPDLNQKNPFMARYLIQNAIWWVEYADLAGIRMDTYSYSDQDFINDWSCAIMNEYPDFSIVGEEWHTDPIFTSQWQRPTREGLSSPSCLPYLMDFPLHAALIESLNNPLTEWSSPWLPLYERLATDFIYPDPDGLMVFADNHDMSRIFTQIDHDSDLLKLALTFIMTTRGIPQLYYGTEIQMGNPGTDEHGIIRSDFPGGWTSDEKNAFTGDGLTAEAKNTQEFVRKLLQWRKDSKAIHEGELRHYAPERGLYIYFRSHGEERVMVILNKSPEPEEFDPKRYRELLDGYRLGFNVMDGSSVSLEQAFDVPALSPVILELTP